MSHLFSQYAHPFWILEAALRSLVMGTVIFAVLKLLRIRQVRAQRTAWVLALLASVAMPTLVRWPIATQWQIPVSVPAVRVATTHAAADRQMTQPISVSQGLATRSLHSIAQPMSMRDSDTYRTRPQTTPRPILRTIDLAAAATQLDPVKLPSRFIAELTVLLRYAATLYFLIAALLLVRLALGVGLTLRLLRRAIPIHFASFPQQDIRISSEIKTPVTIGSSIVLPSASSTWDASKLEIVLAHESAHVQQSDFHVHLLAGVHCALFWFSPYSWWLQRKLSALGEALSDLAALQQAESRSSYAEVLLEFAMPARPPASAIAMARASSLRPRIERLLNDRLFQEAFSGTRRHPFLAASIVPLALLASASLVSVHAAQTVAPVVPAAPAAQIAPDAVPSPAPAAIPPVVAAPSKPSAIPPAPAEPATVPEGASPLIENQSADDAFAALNKQEAESQSADFLKLQKEAVDNHLLSDDTRLQIQKQVAEAQKLVRSLNIDALVREQVLTAKLRAEVGNNYMYNTWNGDTLAYVTGDGSIQFSGNYDEHFKDLRRKIQGDFIYYQHAGKAYVIQDPALLAQAKALYAPIEALGKQQEELGRQQEALGAKQEALGKQQEQVRVPTPDFTKELAQLDQLTAKMKALQSAKTVDQGSLSELEEKMGDIQGRLGELQGQAGEQQGKLGEQQGVLGEQQGKLGEEQGKLGEQEGKLSEEAQRKLKPLIEKAIKDGIAKPVE